MSDASPQEPQETDVDLVSVGLFAYFVLLILTVAALLILPALL